MDRKEHSEANSPNPTYSHPPNQTMDDPWSVDITGHDNPSCSCKPPVPKEPKTPCTRSTPKKQECCERLLELLDPKSKDASRSKVHKPKTPPKVKLANACCDWPVKDSLGPILVLLFQRAAKGLSPKNEFESAIYEFLEKLEPRHRTALQIGIDAYSEIPEARRCGFETRFDDWPDDRAVDPAFITKVLLQEIVTLGRYGVFNKKDGAASAGEMRLWDQAVGPLNSENEHAIVTGPWPWICAVNPGADNVKWYRNRDVVFPDKSDINTVAFNLYEFSITCSTSIPDPTNPKSLAVNCVDNVPAGNFAFCDGGANYNYKAPGTGRVRCLSIPQCVAGQGVALRGFNFTSLNCTVVLKHQFGAFPDITVPCDVMAADNPPTKAASCAVRDVVTFTIPRTIRDGLNDRPVAIGRYTVEVHVPNETNYAPSPGPAPAEFVSNTAAIDVIPPLDLTYQVSSERGNCYEETDGLGSDEVWFRSYTATYQAVGTQSLDLKDADIFREDDLDSGDWIGFPLVTPFQGGLEVSGCVGIAIMGLEVDSDDAANDQVTSFGEAYGLYWKQVYTILTGGAAGGVFGDGLKVLVTTGKVVATLIVGGAALIAIAALGLLFAAWAPADPIAYDLMVYDLITLYKLTTPGSAMPLQDEGEIAHITWSRLPLGIFPTSATTADYLEERQYRAQDEGSKYGLNFKISQLP